MADDGCHILPTFKSKVMEFKRPMFGFLEVSNQPVAVIAASAFFYGHVPCCNFRGRPATQVATLG